ncbi:MAG: DNA-binding protein YbiB [Burkholderiaceae bacterium]|jgi:anthranilate phosphoribosyltransferase|nr:DNA-binding protein YbiB [Burkholderiaceae bacterium]
MSINHYLRCIGRGKHGARALPREQAADLFAQVLDGHASDLATGAFCVAMRFKGIAPEEMLGFLDATHARLARLPATRRPLVVLPSYNGARRLPVLTPLLALLVARAGLPVLLHGCPTEARRVTSQAVLTALGIPALGALRPNHPIADGELVHADTALLCPGIKRLLDVRQAIGLRNPAHSVVKLMQPGLGAQLIISSYTHTEYAHLMTETFERMGISGMLSKGTEGESVADPRRTLQIDGFVRGARRLLQTKEADPFTEPLCLPSALDATDAAATADYTRRVLLGKVPVPEAIERQVAGICALARELE